METARLVGLTLEELAKTIRPFDPLPYRANQVFDAIYRQRRYKLQDVTELPLSLRAILTQACVVADTEIADVFTSEDGTRRYVLRLVDSAMIESVWIPEDYADTICISTQVGCPLACGFCMTGKLGLTRNLDAGEIISEVGLVLNHGYGVGVSPERGVNIVFMGMGEPLLNFDNVMKAVRLLCHPRGMNISQRRITLSTVGLVPKIHDLGREPIRPELAISLSATTDALRDQLMPINTRWPLRELLAACRSYPLRTNEWISFEYVMLRGMNDSDDDAGRFARLLGGIKAKVNLIPHNPAPELSFKAPPDERILEFQRLLRRKGIPTFIRRPRGRDIGGACGQLAARRHK
jgi:23S rRNA (adenine2503-C2)-methyltransferase